MNKRREELKLVGRTARDAMGGNPEVGRYWDEPETSHIDIISFENSPDLGVNSYSTVGLSGYSIDLTIDDRQLRVEIVGACASNVDFFPNIISTCAFNIINSGYSCFPGAMYPDVVKMYLPESTMQHVLFVSPFLWGDLKPDPLDFPDKHVSWLQAIPISENELVYAERNGPDALELLLEEAHVDIFDIDRPPVV